MEKEERVWISGRRQNGEGKWAQKGERDRSGRRKRRIRKEDRVRIGRVKRRVSKGEAMDWEGEFDRFGSATQKGKRERSGKGKVID